MKAGDLFIFNSSRSRPEELEFIEVNRYGNYVFRKTRETRGVPYDRWVWRPEWLKELTPKELWDSPLMKALR